MKIVIYLTLIIIAIAFTAFIIALIMYAIEQHNSETKKLKKIDDEYNQKMIQKCIESKQAGVCPHCCEKCSWNLRSENGIIKFRRKP